MILIDSVYSFVLSKDWRAWIIVSFVLGLQMWMLFMFIDAAHLDFSDDKSVFEYAWKCPRNSEACRFESDSDWKGWVIFAIVMVSDLLADFVSGIKLLVLAGKQRHSRSHKIRLYLGGLSICFVTVLTVFASTVYNVAIARSNPDIVSRITTICSFLSYAIVLYKTLNVFFICEQTDCEFNHHPFHYRYR